MKKKNKLLSLLVGAGILCSLLSTSLIEQTIVKTHNISFINETEGREKPKEMPKEELELKNITAQNKQKMKEQLNEEEAKFFNELTGIENSQELNKLLVDTKLIDRIDKAIDALEPTKSSVTLKTNLTVAELEYYSGIKSSQMQVGTIIKPKTMLKLTTSEATTSSQTDITTMTVPEESKIAPFENLDTNANDISTFITKFSPRLKVTENKPLMVHHHKGRIINLELLPEEKPKSDKRTDEEKESDKIRSEKQIEAQNERGKETISSSRFEDDDEDPQPGTSTNEKGNKRPGEEENNSNPKKPKIETTKEKKYVKH